MNVVIVESAAKAKTINKYLGSGYKVIASYGHVRDLPAKDGSVEPDNDFAMHWDVDPKSQKIMREISDALKGASKLILATDPDREGEAISWHLLEILNNKKAIKKGTETVSYTHLLHLAGLSSDEIAMVLQTKRETVESVLASHRGLRRLPDSLKEELIEEATRRDFAQYRGEKY